MDNNFNNSIHTNIYELNKDIHNVKDDIMNTQDIIKKYIRNQIQDNYSVSCILEKHNILITHLLELNNELRFEFKNECMNFIKTNQEIQEFNKDLRELNIKVNIKHIKENEIIQLLLIIIVILLSFIIIF
jgi:hypothetical protein